jgi:4-hydroxy-tetrahydrodipicolinate synthase
MINQNLSAGVWPVMLTPFCDDGTIDWVGLDALVEWYLEAGVSGLFAVCLSSEMYELTPEERVRLAKGVVDSAAGRVPVVAAGAFGESIPAQAEVTKRIADTGVTAVVLTVNQLAAEDESDAVWQARAETMFDACASIPLGLYECPRPYHRKLTPDLLRWAAETGRVLFLKDTCCDIEMIRAKLDAIQGTAMGWFNANSPTLLGSLKAGGHGYSGVAANFYPELYVWLCANFAKYPAEAAELQAFFNDADQVVHRNYPLGAKQFLALRGLPIGETCRVPVPAARPDDDEKQVLENLREMLGVRTDELAGIAAAKCWD